MVQFGRGKSTANIGEMGEVIKELKKVENDSQQEIEEAASEGAKDVTPEAKKEKS